jgi:LysM repeat protein
MRSIVAAALTLSALISLPAGAASITVKPGDTISGLADRYGVSVNSLLKANGIRNSNHVEVGQTLRLPSGARGVVSAGKGRHSVQSGDTLGGIAARYRVRERDLIAINNLPSADHVEVGQTLKLPTSAVLPKPKPVAKAKPAPITADPNATSHTVARGQTLTQIARAYEVPVASLIDLNTINDPNKVTIGTKLMLRDTRASEITESVSTTVQTSPSPAVKPQLASQPRRFKSNQLSPQRLQQKQPQPKQFRPRPLPLHQCRPSQRRGAPTARSKWTGATGNPWAAAWWPQL